MLQNISRRFYTLSTQIFTMYWVSLILMLGIVFLITKFDMSDYKPLSEKEMVKFQRDISQSIRDHRLGRLIYEDEGYCDIDTLISPDAEVRPVVLDEHNQIICSTPSDSLTVRTFINQANRALEEPLKKTVSNIEVVGPFKIFLNSDRSYQLYILRSVSSQEELFNYIEKYPLLMVLLVMLISSPILYWLARSISKPARELRLAANAVSLGNFKINKELEKRGALEMRLVGASFNHMTSSIDELISNQQQLLSSISHELRTPLTRLQLASSLLRRRIGESKELQRIETEIERLDKMINDLLLLSRQQLNSHLSRSVFPVHEVWESIFADAKFEAEQRDIRFDILQRIPHPEQHELDGNLSLLSSAVENILRNALKYTKDYVLAEIYLKNNELFICVDDNGSGVPDDQYEEIFKPFYRVDEARTRSTGGAGLGLAIVANIVTQHHGEVRAGKSNLGGLHIVIKLPLWRP